MLGAKKGGREGGRKMLFYDWGISNRRCFTRHEKRREGGERGSEGRGTGGKAA